MLTPVPDEIEKFVLHSNMIEGAPTDIKSPWITQHLAGAYEIISDAYLGRLTDPWRLHATLFHGLMDRAGTYRQHNVTIGEDVPPAWSHVPNLMEKWDQTKTAFSPWEIHHSLECIHPFADGNGRVGRLVLNGMNLLHGLSWEIIVAQHSDQYYDSIIKFRHEDWNKIRRVWERNGTRT